MDEELRVVELEEAQYYILSVIEDFCIIFGTNALPGLRDYIDRATKNWTSSPDPSLIEKTC